MGAPFGCSSFVLERESIGGQIKKEKLKMKKGGGIGAVLFSFFLSNF
jgi:hypothetical protein